MRGEKMSNADNRWTRVTLVLILVALVGLFGCASPSLDSSYHLAELTQEQSEVDMSPRSRRSRLRKIIATITPSKKTKSFSSLELSPRIDDEFIKSEELDSTVRYGLNYVALLIKIRLKEGQGLAIRDASGSSDPYVKFKYKNNIFYKSSTVFKNLNPIWDEEFQMLADDMTSPIVIEVFDYDRFCTDDFMGEASIDLSQIKWFTHVDMCVSLKDEAAPNEQLGTINLSVCVVPQTQEEKIQFLHKANRGILSEFQKKKEKLVQMWLSVVNIVLVEGRNLAVNYNTNCTPDPYCKFKLGSEKYKSKICNRTFDPKWVEQFDLHIYDNSSEILEVMCHDKRTNSPMGRMSVDLSSLPRDQTVQKWYMLEESAGSVLLLITVSGAQSKDSVVDLKEFNQDELRNSVIQKYDLLHTHKNIKDIGQLTVKDEEKKYITVFRAEDLQAKDIGGKSDPFAVLELVNTRLQTHTEYKTLNPHWNKLFTFSVKDIHTCLEITVYDEDPNNKFEFLGKVTIPLLSIQNCERRWYALKDKKLQTRVKGEILVEIDIIWNPVRAAIRTFNPREKKYIQQEKKFKASLFRNTVVELKEFGLTVVDYKNYVQSFFNWDSTPRSITAFLIFIFGVYWIEIYHIPILLLLLFIKGYIYKRIAEGMTPCLDPENLKEDDEAEEEKNAFFVRSRFGSSQKRNEESSPSSLRETIFSVQETLAVVQNMLLFICALLQRIKNTFNFTSPWLSWLAVIVLVAITILIYFVPLRWLFMIWGINKFTRKLRNPHFIDSNELLNFLSRVPSDDELKERREFRVDNQHSVAYKEKKNK